ncbi:guanylate cyclase domain-containing protein, partial [Haematococcus lacustris]
CSSSSNGRSKKKQDVAVEVGQGLLSLLAGQLWPELQSSVAASSTTLGEAKVLVTQEDGRMGHSEQLPLALPGAVAQAAHVSHVGWQRLCELYREVEVEEPGALTVLVGLRVRVGLHTGLDADEVLVQSRMGASSTTYGGAALVLAKAVQTCAHGGQVTLSAATFVKLPVEELRAAGISVAHMGQHLVALGEGKGHTALNLYCAFLKTPAHAHRLWALGPLRVARQLQPGVLHAPHGTAATAFMSCHGFAQLKAWDASLAQECLALYQATAQRLLLHVAGLQLPAGYLVSTADEDGMVLAAFPSSLQCLHWALLTLTTCMDLDWPQALLDSVSGEEVVTERQSPTGSAASNGTGPTAMPLEAGARPPGHCHTVRLLRGLRLKAGVDVGEVACDLTPANGRFNYRGRCLNRAARINGLALSGQVGG